jgi:hypothetical protein
MTFGIVGFKQISAEDMSFWDDLGMEGGTMFRSTSGSG